MERLTVDNLTECWNKYKKLYEETLPSIISTNTPYSDHEIIITKEGVKNKYKNNYCYKAGESLKEFIEKKNKLAASYYIDAAVVFADKYYKVLDNNLLIDYLNEVSDEDYLAIVDLYL